MPTPILMPALSPTMEEGTLAKWNVKEGDTVSSGDIIAEIETDKATMEVEAVDEGIVGKILVDEGAENVKVNALIAVLLEDGESAGDIDIAALGAVGGGTSGNANSSDPAPASAMNGHDGVSASSAVPMTAQNENSTNLSSAGSGRIHASPLAKRIAKQENLDLSQVKGTGPHGRIVKRDVEKALKEGVGKSSPASFTPSPASIDHRLYAPDSYEAVKLDGMRKVIARRLTQSFNNEVPHFPLNVDIELDSLLTARKRINALSPSPDRDPVGAYKVSVNDFIIKASALALKKVPAANASYTDEAILLHKHADIGVAVAIDGGLITPIVWKMRLKIWRAALKQES